jgi:hypothetical protein
MRPEIAQERQRAQAAFDAAERSMAREESDAAEKSKALRPVRDRMMELATRPLPEPPKEKEAPPVPKRNDQHDDENWLMAAGLLGGLAGALTRNHATNALAAFSGALQGYQEGSRKKFDENMKIWEAENNKAIEANRNAQDRYRNILQDRKMNIDQMSIALQVAGAEFEDRGMVTAAKTKNSLVMAQYHDQNVRAMEQMQSSADRLSESRERAERKEAANDRQRWVEAAQQYVVSPEGQARIQATVNLQRPPPSQAAPRNSMLGMREAAIADELSARGYDWTKWTEKGAGARVAGATEARKDQRTEIAFAVGPEARSVRSLNVAIAHLDTLDNLSRALGASDYPRLNQLSNRVETELGYAMPKSFDAAKQIVSAEIIKAVVANGGGVNERRDAAENIDKSGSYEQLSQVIGTYKSLLGGQMKGLQKQYEHNTGKTDFLDMLEPETINALNAAGIAPTPSKTPPGYKKTGDDKSIVDQIQDPIRDYFAKPEPPMTNSPFPPFQPRPGIGLPEGYKLEPVQ